MEFWRTTGLATKEDIRGALKSSDRLLAVCERNGKKHRVDVNSLEWVKPRPEGFEWIEAYLL